MLNRQKQAVNIENIEPNKLQDIFLSEEYFWLITALAAACDREASAENFDKLLPRQPIWSWRL